MTGGYLRPGFFNKPLPRLKPQPESITMMIFKRRRARNNRVEKMRKYTEWQDSIRAECEFEARLANTVRQSGLNFTRHFESFEEWSE
jgi:hypothetical protein